MHTQNNMSGSTERGRWTSVRKNAAVMRLLWGEDLDALNCKSANPIENRVGKI